MPQRVPEPQSLARGLALAGILVSLSLLAMAILLDMAQQTAFVLALVGTSILGISLSVLQIILYREGDSRARVHTAITSIATPGPTRGSRSANTLRNPRHRAIQQHLDEIRTTLKRKEEQTCVQDMHDAAQALALVPPEKLRMVLSAPWYGHWGTALFSFSLLLLSTLLDGNGFAFLLLALGLMGLLCSHLVLGRQTIYVTSHRLLRRTPSILGNSSRWQVLQLDDPALARLEDHKPILQMKAGKAISVPVPFRSGRRNIVKLLEELRWQDHENARSRGTMA